MWPALASTFQTFHLVGPFCRILRSRGYWEPIVLKGQKPSSGPPRCKRITAFNKVIHWVRTVSTQTTCMCTCQRYAWIHCTWIKDNAHSRPPYDSVLLIKYTSQYFKTHLETKARWSWMSRTVTRGKTHYVTYTGMFWYFLSRQYENVIEQTLLTVV